ncbi:MAG: hypothetical protein L3J46_03490 [Kangiellaceae bacterium]|nr:hypothetical protein [Kangiellaceae bacterium]
MGPVIYDRPVGKKDFYFAPGAKGFEYYFMLVIGIAIVGLVIAVWLNMEIKSGGMNSTD